MDCDQLKLSLFFDRQSGLSGQSGQNVELSDTEHAELTSHIEQCAACADTLKGWQAVQTHLASAVVPRFQRRPSAFPLLASAAALALTLSVGFALRPRQEAPVYQVQVTGARLLDCEVRLDGREVQINTKEQSP